MQMSFSDSVFYYWSDKEWDSCDKFRSAATGVLNPKGFPDMLEWTGSDTTVRPLLCLTAAFDTEIICKMHARQKPCSSQSSSCGHSRSDNALMQVFIKGSQNTSQALIDIVKNKTYGEPAMQCPVFRTAAHLIQVETPCCRGCCLCRLHLTPVSLLLQWAPLTPPGPTIPWCACQTPSQMLWVSPPCKSSHA